MNSFAKPMKHNIMFWFVLKKWKIKRQSNSKGLETPHFIQTFAPTTNTQQPRRHNAAVAFRLFDANYTGLS